MKGSAAETFILKERIHVRPVVSSVIQTMEERPNVINQIWPPRPPIYPSLTKYTLRTIIAIVHLL